MAAPVPVDLVEPAFDDGRVDLVKSILEGGRAFEVVRARLCDGTKETSLVLSIWLGLVVLVWDWSWDRVDAGFGTSNSFLTGGGFKVTLKLGWEESTGGIFVATRFFGLSGTELACMGIFGIGGWISLGGGAGTIVILLGPVCILGTSTDTTPGCTRLMPPLRGGGWFMMRLGPGRAATCTRVWDIALILVDVVESALILWVECWERAEAGRTRWEGSDWRAGLVIGFADGRDGGTGRVDRDGTTPCD